MSNEVRILSNRWNLLCVTSFTYPHIPHKPIRSPHLVRYQFVASKWVIISPDAIAAKNLSETNLLSVAGPRPFYVGRASCWRGWGKNFLFSFLTRREKMEWEAAWITQAGRTGRWETNVPLISRWWTRSGRAPPPPSALPLWEPRTTSNKCIIDFKRAAGHWKTLGSGPRDEEWERDETSAAAG